MRDATTGGLVEPGLNLVYSRWGLRERLQMQPRHCRGGEGGAFSYGTPGRSTHGTLPGVGRCLCSLYLELRGTARRHTPCTIEITGSVLACTGSQPHRGSPTTRESRRRPLQFSPTSLRQRPSVHRMVWRGPKERVVPHPKKALFGAPTYTKISLMGLYGSHSPTFIWPRSAARGEGPGTRAIMRY